MKTRIATIAFAALALGAVPARALEISGAGDVGYVRGAAGTTSLNFGGSALFAFEYPGLQAQMNASDEHISQSPFSADLIDIGTDIFWRDAKGTLGFSLMHHNLTSGGSPSTFNFTASAALTSYGGFGEWYASPKLTLGLRGGGYNGDASGYYMGLGGGYYVMSNVSASLGFDYIKPSGGSKLSIISAGVEYMPWKNLPLSFVLSDSYATTSSQNAFGIAIRFRFGSVAQGDMPTWDRRGPIGWNGALPL